MEAERVIDRLDKYMEYRGLNDNQVTVNARLSVGLLNNARRGKYDIGKKTINKILSFYQDLNMVWLLTGTGEMLNGNTPPIVDRKAPLIRILNLLEREGISLEAFAKKANSNEKQFNRAIQWPFDSNDLFFGNEKQVLGWVESFCCIFPKYSKDWILYGTPPMILPEKAAVQSFDLQTDQKKELRKVPIYEIEASAGFLAVYQDHTADISDYITIPNLPPVDGAIYARGDSMSPLIASGDIVIFKKVELHPDNIIWGSIYIISYTLDGDDFTVLKYIRHSNKDGYIRLESYNPRFDPQDIPSSSITALALVKASITFHTIG